MLFREWRYLAIWEKYSNLNFRAYILSYSKILWKLLMKINITWLSAIKLHKKNLENFDPGQGEKFAKNAKLWFLVYENNGYRGSGVKNDFWLFSKISMSLNHCFLQNVKNLFRFKQKLKGVNPFAWNILKSHFVWKFIEQNWILTFCKKQWFRLNEIFKNNQTSFLDPFTIFWLLSPFNLHII